MLLRSCPARHTPARFRRFPTATLCLVAVLGVLSPVAAQTVGTVTARPAESQASFEEAKLLYDGGQYAAAERAFDRFLDEYPRDARAPEALFFFLSLGLDVVVNSRAQDAHRLRPVLVL